MNNVCAGCISGSFHAYPIQKNLKLHWRYVESEGKTIDTKNLPADPWNQLPHALLAANEFVFVDSKMNFPIQNSRREFLGRCGLGVGSLALANILSSDGLCGGESNPFFRFARSMSFMCFSTAACPKWILLIPSRN